MKSPVPPNRFVRLVQQAGRALALMAALLAAPRAQGDAAPFGVPVRLSFKFFLNASGNRAATGDINTDEEVRAQVERGNQILTTWTHELRLHLVEIVDLSGLSQWYPATTDNRDAILRVQLADKQRDKKAAIAYLLEAERHAAARERDAVRLELAQRYRDSGELEEAEAWFLKLAAESDQPGLRERCRNKANDARAEIERRRQQKQQPQNEPEPTIPQAQRGEP